MHALDVLEFDLIRKKLAAHCETEVGEAAALELTPVFDAEAVWQLQSLTREGYELLGHQSLPSLGSIRDFREPLRRAERGGVVDGATLYQIGESISAMRSLRMAVQSRKDLAPGLWLICEPLPDLKELESKLRSSLDGSGEVRDEASPELGRLRRQRASRALKILDRIQAYTSGKNRELLSDPIYTQREGRYVVPLKSENRGKIKGVVHDTSGSGQTLFIEPEEIVQLGNDLRIAEAAEQAEVARILAELSAKVGAHGSEIGFGVEAASDVDLVLGKARLGYEMDAVAPIKAKDASIKIVHGKHPLLDPSSTVPLDLEVGIAFVGVLITGPNTGGKTVAIKTVGLFALMAQSGLMLPAAEVRLGCFSQVWADIGDEQSLQQSLSTFSAHIKNIGEAIKGLREGALVLFDEIGAGTDPAEGASLAKAILERLRDGGARIVASTHYGELKVFAYNAEGFTNAAMEFDPKTLRPTYRLIMGAPGASHALKIAERLGIPRQIVEQARQGLGIGEQDVARMIEKLEVSQRQAQKAQGEADRLTARLRQVESEAEKKLQDASQAKREARAQAADALEEALREIRLEATEIFEQLKADASAKSIDAARTKLKQLQEAGASRASEFRPDAPKGKRTVEVARGMSVRIEGYSQVGTVLSDVKDGKVQVQIGVMKMWVETSALSPAEEPATKKTAPRQSLGLQKMTYATTELHLRMMRAEDAEIALEKFIDDAILAGLPSIRIVHGKGEGVLRKLTQDHLRRHKGVKSFREAEPSEGGQGATIAMLE